MNTCPHFQYLLILPHLRVQNANAISSPLTHGFPSMTAFLGLMWALQRKTSAAGLDLEFKAVGVVCHDHQEQASDDGYVKTFHLTRNPIEASGKTAAIIEEGRIHLELSLVFAVTSKRWSQASAVCNDEASIAAELLTHLRIAGGTLLPPRHPRRSRYTPWALELTGTDDDRRSVFTRARMRLLPGFTLVSRPDLLEIRLAELAIEHPDMTRLDAWLSWSRRQWRYQKTGTSGEKGRWQHEYRKGRGWIVPIPVGYGALGCLHAPGSVANTRDPAIPFCFVESLYSIGQWISPHHLHQPEQLLWYTDTRPDTGAYLCRNDYRPDQDSPDSRFDEDF